MRKISGRQKRKKQEKQLQCLTEDVHRQRIAIKHISHIRRDENKMSEQIESVKNELHEYVTLIHSQEKKHVVLRDLISILKGQMTKMQAKQMEEKQRISQELEKNIKQLSDDVDKISLKKNHQVAKIAKLKEYANQSRSERVVYSNLFKKLEKQLKESEELYKSELLRAEKNKIYYLNQSANQIGKTKSQYQGKSINLEEQQTGQNSKYNNINNCKQNVNQGIFFNINRTIDKKVKQDEVKLNNKQDKRFDSSRDSVEENNLMEELNYYCDQVKNQLGCRSVEEIKYLMSTIDNQNQQYQLNISLTNKMIQETERKGKLYVNQLSLIKSSQKFSEFQQFQDIRRSQHTKRSKNKIIIDRSYDVALEQQKCISKLKNTQEESNTIQNFTNLCQLLGYDSQSFKLQTQFLNLNSLGVKQQCQTIDNIVNELYYCMDSCSNTGDAKIQYQNMQTFTLGDNSILNESEIIFKSTRNGEVNCSNSQMEKQQNSEEINWLLGKITKFGNCEKFLDKDGFYNEYYREMSKKEKNKFRKN